METLRKQTFKFADFELDPAKRLLLKRGEAVALKSKTLDLLLTLVAHRGQVLSKEVLLDKVWTGQFVEENNLTVQISALRKILGEKKGEHQFIVNVPGKGYKFVADVRDSIHDDKEIIIESRKFSYVLIEEDILEQSACEIPLEKINIPPPPPLPGRERQKRQGASYKTSLFILCTSLGLILTAFFAGAWFWEPKKTIEKKLFSIVKLTSAGKISNAALTPDAKYAVFSQTEESGESLWLRHLETGSQTQILPVKAVKYVGLTTSPDGNLIYATVFGSDLPDPQIWRLPVLGGVIEEIKHVKTGAAVSLSPDGSRLAFTESRSALKETHLGIADSNGEHKQILIRAEDERRSFPNFNENPVAWSPDAKEIACIVEEKQPDGGKKSGILLVDPADASERFISEMRWEYAANLAWVDAETLAFIAYKTNPWQGQIWTVSRKSGEARQITKELSSYEWLASAGGKLLTVQKTAVSHARIFDFDGKEKILKTREVYSESGYIDNISWTRDDRILYSSSASGKPEIWRMRKDGTSREQLTVNANVGFGISVSPIDGSIVFGSSANGKHVLSIADLDGRNVRPLTDGTEDVFPNFTSDGQSVIFQRGLNNKTLTIWRYDFNGGKVTRLTDTHASHPAVAPDGMLTAYYFMDREFDNLWRVGLISNENGALVGKINLPSQTSERRMRWHPSGRFLTQIFYAGENANLLLLPRDGGAPKAVTQFGKGNVNWFEWSRDGESLVASQTEISRDIVLIKDF